MRLENNNGTIEIIKDAEGKNLVLVNDIRFKGHRKIDWTEVEEYLKEYVGKNYEILETSERIYIGNDFPDEFCHSKDTKVLKGTNAKAKANASQAIGKLIQIIIHFLTFFFILKIVIENKFLFFLKKNVILKP